MLCGLHSYNSEICNVKSLVLGLIAVSLALLLCSADVVHTCTVCLTLTAACIFVILYNNNTYTLCKIKQLQFEFFLSFPPSHCFTSCLSLHSSFFPSLFLLYLLLSFSFPHSLPLPVISASLTSLSVCLSVCLSLCT